MVKTVLVFFFLWLSIILALPVGLLALALRLLGLRYAAARLLQRFGRLWARAMLAGMGCRVTVTGAENIPRSGGVCFIGNHPGDVDPILAMAYIDRPFGFTAKKEALFYPVINIWVWLLGGVFIDRKNVGSARRAIEAGARRIRAGGAMIIFPEGTRNRGKAMLPFRGGAFKLATLAEAPIVPLTIIGSNAVYEDEGRIRGAQIALKFWEAVPTAGLDADARRALPEQVRAKIAEGLGPSAAPEEH